MLKNCWYAKTNFGRNNMHAYFYRGAYETMYALLPDEVKKGGPDVFVERGDLLTVGNALFLRNLATRTPVAGTSLHIVVAYDRLMPQAQNALLKELEETTNVIWYIIVPRRDILIPTLRSRLTEITLNDRGESMYADESFLTMSYVEKMSAIATLYAKSKSDEEKINTHRSACAIVSACEQFAHEDPTARADLLRDILFARTYLDQPGASGKMLMELLALDMAQ